jgi:CDP-diacylglycerol---glycerol-3-phosphate 3-phosphatidyltransferase
MNLPNLLSLARIVLVPVLLVVMLIRIPYGHLLAAVVFIAAAVTDGVDGYIARTTGQVTRLGKFLDPLADKLLISAALIALVELGLLTTWVAMVIVGREMAVTGLRAIAAGEGTVIAAGPWGKAKTVAQIVAIVAALLASGTPSLGLLTGYPGTLEFLATWTMVIAVFLTIYSGLIYLWRFFQTREGGKPPLRFRFKLPLRRGRQKGE